MKIFILDGYVDEPAHFGVPPYISAYPRYIAGIAMMTGFEVIYDTIDGVRAHGLKDADILVTVGGVTVPGNYIGGLPLTTGEAEQIANNFIGTKKILIGSMAYYDVDRTGGVMARPKAFAGYDLSLWNGYEKTLYELFKGKKWMSGRYELVKEASKAGCEIIKHHPNFPDIMCEIELGMGCEKMPHCTFCTEPLWGRFVSRPPEDIIEEIGALYKNGARHFRLGRISNIFAYMSKGKPDPFAIETLYEGIRKVAVDLKTLHTDNANPGYIFSYMEASKKIAEIIASKNTPGDILSMGVESFDPKVVSSNNLKIGKNQLMDVVRMINHVGAERVNGVPKLLPGINLLYGLTGESRKTYYLNFRALMDILEEGLMVRRVNIRKVMVFPDTPLFDSLNGKSPKIDEKMYLHYKSLVRNSFDHEMLKRVFPVGTILRDVIIEINDKNLSYGRQMGTYPILVGIPKIILPRTHVDCIVVDHGQRSLTALPIPLKINSASYELLKWVPNFGRSTLAKIIINRPFDSLNDMIEKTGCEVPDWMNGMIEFER